ncbi:MAG: hypothetical protein P8L31_07595 [Pseudomonadales bacterium]|jgi:hypothetical protein|nr:hypothetical protein [Pseudomonadales bacterium]
MSEKSINDQQQVEASDSAADAKVILVVFVAAVAFAVHLISGFTFDF